MSKIVEFFKKNLGLIYSIGLIFVIPVILFFFVFAMLNRFEKNFNNLLQTKALLLENVIAVFWQESSWNSTEAQRKIEEIMRNNSDVAEIQVVAFTDKMDKERIIVAASDKNLIGKSSDDQQDFWAISLPEGVATLANDGRDRFWKVAKKISDSTGQNLVIKTSLSLKEVDETFNQNLRHTYWMLAVVSLILVLLVTNYARLSRYVFLFNKVKEVDKMKDDFISMASHELRTPLVAISGYVDLLSSSQKNASPEEKKFLENIQFSVERLKNLVNDILEVSRLEQNRIPFNFEKVSLGAFLKKVVNSFQNSALEKGLKLNWKNSLAEGTFLWVDPARLEQIMVNLIGNAIKYTPQGQVEVNSSEKGDKILISVEDTGLGISAEGQKNLFTKFYRVKNKATEKIIGTGLGLWITKQLIEKMSGEISVESIEGKGTKFIVSFPKDNKN